MKDNKTKGGRADDPTTENHRLKSTEQLLAAAGTAVETKRWWEPEKTEAL